MCITLPIKHIVSCNVGGEMCLNEMTRSHYLPTVRTRVITLMGRRLLRLLLAWSDVVSKTNVYSHPNSNLLLTTSNI